MNNDKPTIVKVAETAAVVGVIYLFIRAIYRHPIIVGSILLAIFGLEYLFARVPGGGPVTFIDDILPQVAGWAAFFFFIIVGGMILDGKTSEAGIVIGSVFIVGFIAMVIGGYAHNVYMCSDAEETCATDTLTFYETQQTPSGLYVHSLASIHRSEWSSRFGYTEPFPGDLKVAPAATAAQVVATESTTRGLLPLIGCVVVVMIAIGYEIFKKRPATISK